MRPSIRLLVKPVPISSIPVESLRLAPKPSPSINLDSNSPTLSKLLSRLSTSQPSTRRAATERGEGDLPADGRGIGGGRSLSSPPPNLRVEEYVPKRTEFEGVNKKHRDLLRRLRREA
ncbi:hypothetical protein JCM3766R1_001880 [Sporobolomyces carnicolor]